MKNRESHNNALTTAEYNLRLSLLSPYRKAPAIPFYINMATLAELRRAWCFLRNFEGARPPQELASEAEYFEHYLRVDSLTRQQEDIQTASPAELASGCVVLSALAPEASSTCPSIFHLPVERFYGQDNPGSGRHVRFAGIELKGSGRNRCALRNDWWHGWGGMGMEEAVGELYLSKSVNAASPLGAVPIIFAAFYRQSSTPAVLEQAETAGEKSHIVLSTLARSAEYTRLANLYFAPGAPELSTKCLPEMESILEQYAALTAFGHFHLMPSDDNLTLEGLCLDASSLFTMNREHHPRTLLIVFDKFRHRLSRATPVLRLLRYLEDQPLYYACSSASYLHALKAISVFREKLGADHLRGRWEERYLQAIARYWLIKKGFPQRFAMDHACDIACCFHSQFDAEGLTPERYLKSANLRIDKIRKEQDRALVEIRQYCPHEEMLLKSFLGRHAKARCRLVEVYNRRNREHSLRREPPKQYLKPAQDVFAEANFHLNYSIMTGRMYNPRSVEHTSCDLSWELAREGFHVQCDSLGSALSAIGSKSSGGTSSASICWLSDKGGLVRKTVETEQCPTGFVIRKAALPEMFLLEGVTLKCEGASVEFCMPLPITLIGGQDD